jgi:hypothetical protein
MTREELALILWAEVASCPAHCWYGWRRQMKSHVSTGFAGGRIVGTRGEWVRCARCGRAARLALALDPRVGEMRPEPPVGRRLVHFRGGTFVQDIAPAPLR